MKQIFIHAIRTTPAAIQRIKCPEEFAVVQAFAPQGIVCYPIPYINNSELSRTYGGESTRILPGLLALPFAPPLGAPGTVEVMWGSEMWQVLIATYSPVPPAIHHEPIYVYG